MLATPGLVFICLFFIVPVGLILLQSVLDHGFTLAFYRRLFSAPEYLAVFSISFKIALTWSGRSAGSSPNSNAAAAATWGAANDVPSAWRYSLVPQIE